MKSNRSVPNATVMPVLAYPDLQAAVDWLTGAFGFTERLRIPDHRSQLTFGAGAMVATQRDVENETKTHSVLVRVDDARVHCERARQFGAQITTEPTDHRYGERQYTAIDIGGHSWTFSQTIADVAPEDWGGITMSPTSSAPAIDFGRSTPILRVADLDASIAFYTEKLRFALDWRAEGFASIHRGRAVLMLCEGDQGHAGTWVYVGVSDADALHEELVARGVAIRNPPSNYPWGAREIQLADPDGHVLRFGSDAIPGEPLGYFTDGDGVRWQPRPDGGSHRLDES